MAFGGVGGGFFVDCFNDEDSGALFLKDPQDPDDEGVSFSGACGDSLSISSFSNAGFTVSLLF